jgi:hypothetical protein
MRVNLNAFSLKLLPLTVEEEFDENWLIKFHCGILPGKFCPHFGKKTLA